MIDTITVQIKLVSESCCVCGCVFGMTSDVLAARRRDRQSFYCPNGHAQSYTESADQRRIKELEKERDRLKTTNEYLSADLQLERSARVDVQHKLRATKGVLTKTRKRVGNGVCPCCNRTFTNLQRHMHTKHPEYAQPEEAGAVTA